MSARELTAAGIHSTDLRDSYERCRQLNAAHGKTYYLATKLLPPAKRPYVHALYGFARYADEIVDDLSSTLSDHDKAQLLSSWGDAFLADVRRGRSDAMIRPGDQSDLPVELWINHVVPPGHRAGCWTALSLQSVPPISVPSLWKWATIIPSISVQKASGRMTNSAATFRSIPRASWRPANMRLNKPGRISSR